VQRNKVEDKLTLRSFKTGVWVSNITLELVFSRNVVERRSRWPLTSETRYEVSEASVQERLEVLRSFNLHNNCGNFDLMILSNIEALMPK
jgi:hypothetical protein